MSILLRPEVKILYLRDARKIYTQGGNGLCYATPDSIGLDLRACFTTREEKIRPGSRICVPTGIAVEPVTQNLAGFIYSRSGLGAVQGLTVAQGTGVIDPDYRGEITVILLNTSSEVRYIKIGERIAQLIFQPAYQVTLREVETLSPTERGTKGFGHTGK